MEQPGRKAILATLSQCLADRDKAAAYISQELENGGNVTKLKKLFKKRAQAEITIEAIQIYFAQHFPLPKQEEEQK